jgi:hypothetical protein
MQYFPVLPYISTFLPDLPAGKTLLRPGIHLLSHKYPNPIMYHMKKTLLLFLLGIFLAEAHAQRISEGFNGSISPPGWTLNNPSLLLEYQETVNGYGDPYHFPGSVMANNMNVSATSELTSPSFAMATVAGDSLRFDIAAAAMGGNPDSFYVHVFDGAGWQVLRGWGLNSAPDTGITTASSPSNPFVPASYQWRTKVIALPAGTMNVKFVFVGSFGNRLFLDNVVIDNFSASTMVHDSTTTFQNLSVTYPGARNHNIIGIRMHMSGSSTPLTADMFDFSTGSGNGAITNAKLFYTGSSPFFDTTHQYGSTVTAPGAAYTISGTQTLVPGANYFWLAYTIPPTAATSDSLDAACLSISLGGVTTIIPTVSSPDGTIHVGTYYDFEAATDERFISFDESGLVPNQWARGTAASAPNAPPSAHSGNKVWKTNLAGNYMNMANSVLESPTFVATGTNVEWSFMEALDMDMPFAFVTLQYEINNGGWNDAMPPYTYTGQNFWTKRIVNIPANPGDTIVMRWRFMADKGTPGAGWSIDDVVFGNVFELPMLLRSHESTHPATRPVGVGLAKQVIMRVNLEAAGTKDPLFINGFTFTTGTSVNITANVDSARLFYSGNHKDFTRGVQVGSTVVSPNGVFNFIISQELAKGNNLFWLVYDVSATATIGDMVDATCDSIWFAGPIGMMAPTDPDPAGNFMIARSYDFESAAGDNQGFTPMIVSGSIQEWERGTPSGGLGAPTSAFGGSKCWATNLTGNYSANAEYALYSPVFLATTNNVTVDFQEFFNVDPSFCQITVQAQVNNGSWMDLHVDNGQTTEWRKDEIDLPGLTANDTVQFRFKFFSDIAAPIKAGWYIDDMIFGGVTELSQVVTSVSAQQVKTMTAPGKTNLPVLRFEVNATGSANPLTATSFDLEAIGGNIAPLRAKIFYTGDSKAFDTTRQFGSTVISPTGTFTVTGTRELVNGTNFFWLAYDVPATAVYNDSLDAVCHSAEISSVAYTPANGDPEGISLVGLYYDFEGVSDQGFTTYTVSGSTNSQWQRGTFAPSTYTPAAAYSGTKVWKTNLNGNYVNDADHALRSPVFIATGPTVRWSYMEALDLQACCDFIAPEVKVNSGPWSPADAPYAAEKQNWWLMREYEVPAVAGDTVVFRWRLASDVLVNASGLMIDDVLFSGVNELASAYASSTTFQDTTPVAPGFKKQVILGINITGAGSNGPLVLTDLDLATTGTSVTAHIDAAHVYYTGNTATFNDRQLFGSVTSPSGGFTVSGTQTITHGDNFFWVVYDISAATSVAELFDAECSALTINGTVHLPALSAPTEVISVGTGYDFEASSPQNFSSMVVGGIAPDEWERGTPTGGKGAPAAAHSGNNVWGNNLAGNYNSDADYALLSPRFVSTDATQLVFHEHYNTPSEFWMMTGMLVEYQVNAGGWVPLTLFYKGRVTEWTKRAYMLPNVAGDTIQVRWRFSSDRTEKMAGWHIDDVIFTNVSVSDLQGPVISYKPLGGDSSKLVRNVVSFATITDYTVVDVSAGGEPRLYFKKSSDDNVFSLNDNTVNGWKYVTATNTTSPFSFDIDYTLLHTAVATGDTIQYFVTAQDSVDLTYRNISAHPSEGFAATAGPAYTVSSAPSVPFEYYITDGPLNGDYEVGAARDYNTLTEALADLNYRGASGAVNFLLTDAEYSPVTGEMLPINITEFPGASATNRLTIKPAPGTTATIRGDFFLPTVIRLDGADYVTIEGSNNGTSSRDLSIDMFDCETGIWVSSQGLNMGAEHNIMRNLNIFALQQERRTGIVLSGTGVFEEGADNNYNLIENNHIHTVANGIIIFGSEGALNDLTIRGNAIGSDSAGMEVMEKGIAMRGVNQADIGYNSIYNIIGLSGRGGSWTSGIEIADAVTNVSVHHNTIRKIESLVPREMSAKGIVVIDGTGTGNISIANNMITEVISDGTFHNMPDAQPVGININGGSNYQIYHNTVHMTGLRPDNGMGSNGACLWVDRDATGLDVRNNIFSMFQDRVSSSMGYSYNIVANVSSTAFTALDYNMYFDSTRNTTSLDVYIGKIGGAGYRTLASWRTATGKEANSRRKEVSFVSNRDAHLAAPSIGDYSLAGTTLASVTTDIDGQTRNIIPYMGADEITGSPLPVKLMLFAATLKGDDAVLTWKTASETANEGFDVEVSSDGKTFERIGYVKGAGNSSTARTYMFNHAHAFDNRGTRNYYRLKQIDRNGGSEYSEIVSVSRTLKDAAAMLAYPNPFTDVVTIEFSNAVAEQVAVEVYDLFGKKVYAHGFTSAEGMNTLQLNDLHTLTTGIYQLRVITSTGVRSFKVIRE